VPAKHVWFNGQLVPGDQPSISVYDHGLLYGDGVFEGIRIYKDRVLKMRTHLRRLFQGARSIHLNIPYSTEQLEQAIRDAAKANGISDGYIRLVVTRGIGNLGLNPYLCPKPNVFVIADTITLYPAEMYEKGMAIITAATIRNHPAANSAQVKSLNYLGSVLAKIEAVNAGAPEALMLNHLGYVAECTADNIFAVRHRNGKPVLMTPPLHAGILEGVTRGIVMDLARAAGIEVAEPDMTRHDLFTADEMFLTGTAAEVIPVTKLDARPIANGEVGPITRQLIAAFKKLVQHAPED
jgi:branched-chain amino acid aminotransferase